MKAILGLVNGLMTTRNTRAGKSPAVVGRAKKHEKFVMRSAYLVRCALPCLKSHSYYHQQLPNRFHSPTDSTAKNSRCMVFTKRSNNSAMGGRLL
jgi:hypothetical protein